MSSLGSTHELDLFVSIHGVIVLQHTSINLSFLHFREYTCVRILSGPIQYIKWYESYEVPTLVWKKLWRSEEEYFVEMTMMEPTKFVSAFGLRNKWNGAPSGKSFGNCPQYPFCSPSPQPYEKLWKLPTIPLLWKTLKTAHHTSSKKGFGNCRPYPCYERFWNWATVPLLWKGRLRELHTMNARPIYEGFGNWAAYPFPSMEGFESWRAWPSLPLLWKVLEIAQHTPRIFWVWVCIAYERRGKENPREYATLCRFCSL